MKGNSDKDNFRELHSSVTAVGGRKWMYALKPEGKWYNYRSYISYFYLILFFTLPFISVGGHPLFQFNILKGEFYFFSVLFTPQDFVMFGLGMLIFIFIVIVFTMIFGRLFCGWVCPQTIFMEMVFRKIEYWIEGNGNRQKLNDHKEWTTELILRKGFKHFIFLLISFAISITFLMYIIGERELFLIIQEPIKDHLTGFIALIFFTLVFYAVYAFVREIVCTVVCPYGRLQGVLVDSHTLSVSYDYVRGEPRTRQKTEEFGGDCIDCNLCIQVCPTGIDIRNGSSQMECTQCTACIDACNMMMAKVKRPLGLIKYASASNIESLEKFGLTSRVKTFLLILIALIGLLTLILATRKIVDVTVFKVPGQVLRYNQDGTVSNLYSMKITNKGKLTIPITLVLDQPVGIIETIGLKPDSLFTESKIDYLFFITLPVNKSDGRKGKVNIKLMSNSKQLYSGNLDFILKL